jgi:hypothetical protein
MNEIKYDFEELPTIVEDGFEAAFISGTATIGYDDEGGWSVREIALDGFRLRDSSDPCPLIGGMFDRQPVTLCRKSNPWLYETIIDRLENSRFRVSIDDAVTAARDEARELRGRRASGFHIDAPSFSPEAVSEIAQKGKISLKSPESNKGDQ